MKRALVVGQGSIGQRHKRVLESLGFSVATVSRHLSSSTGSTTGSGAAASVSPNFLSISEGLGFNPSYVVIANATAEHAASLKHLAEGGFKGQVLVEKPVFADIEQDFSNTLAKTTFVGYQLRFHPLIVELRRRLQGQRVLSVQSYVGQYLPGWRSARPYQESYSAFRDQGGGVLRDLSHEIDLILHCFGAWKSVTARLGRFSDLEIQSEDTAVLMLEMTQAPVISVEMNYNDRVSQRRMTVNTNQDTFVLDLVKGQLVSSAGVQEVKVDRDQAFMAMHEDASSAAAKTVCRYDEALEVMRVIASAEKSSKLEKWVSR